MVMTLWHLGVLLEDPYDPGVTDGVSCGELAAQLAWVRARVGGWVGGVDRVVGCQWVGG
jgi:hypothetical protein